MSNNNYYGGQPPPPPPHNQGWQQPPPNAYPPQNQSQFSQQPPYSQPYSPQPPYQNGPPQQSFPQQLGYHPQSPYPPQYGGHVPPPAPPQGYPQQGYAPPPQAHQAPYGHPQGPYPPQPGYGAPAPQPLGPQPSLGYDPNPTTPVNIERWRPSALALRRAMEGLGTDEKTLIQVLSGISDPREMRELRLTYQDVFNRSLEDDLHKETSNHFRETLVALCRGPLVEDAKLVDEAVKGAGTNELLLNDVVLGRSNADMNAIKSCFNHFFRKDMHREIREDLSFKTKNLFEWVLNAQRAEESSVEPSPQLVEQNVDRLHASTEGKRGGVDQDAVCHMMAHASDGMIRRINMRFEQKYRMSLDKLYSKHFSSHMEDALRLMAARAINPVTSDAVMLEASMKGLGTKDTLLITRLIRAHWKKHTFYTSIPGLPHDKDHFSLLLDEYKRLYKKDLVSRISGETSGDYRALLLAICHNRRQ